MGIVFTGVIAKAWKQNKNEFGLSETPNKGGW